MYVVGLSNQYTRFSPRFNHFGKGVPESPRPNYRLNALNSEQVITLLTFLHLSTLTTDMGSPTQTKTESSQHELQLACCVGQLGGVSTNCTLEWFTNGV